MSHHSPVNMMTGTATTTTRAAGNADPLCTNRTVVDVVADQSNLEATSEGTIHSCTQRAYLISPGPTFRTWSYGALGPFCASINSMRSRMSEIA
jgi:hypothetical protein